MIHTNESVWEMIEDCSNVKTIPESRGGPGFNDWEQKFIESIRDQYNKNIDMYRYHRLSKKQIEKLRAMWDKI